MFVVFVIFFFKQKTAYEMRISDWSSDVCSSDLNYDRIVRTKGRRAVALITGEEKIVPANPRWFVCTVESMPLDRLVDFLAIDEIQLCADADRGHVFTDRLLHARGREETLFLGPDTVRGVLRQLVPGASGRAHV